MQCGAGARPEWTGKRLVAVKRMKRVWEGGWEQASKIGELVVSRLGYSYVVLATDESMLHRFDSHSERSRITQPSSPCMTPFFNLIRKSSTLSLNAWKGTFTS
jgi:hypothetical protein